jgi:tetratricopeptide (TPR) repeat protein
LAEKYKSEAFFRVEQAEEALANNEFDRARDQLRIAGERFDRSLEVQEDPELKEERDNLIANLGDEINTAENNLIVAEVRELIEQGKAYYAQESYAQAERVFQKAQSRWKVTHVENKPEIEYWLGIIRIALNVKSGRVIDETDPLYAEMSRLINLAKEDFNRGRELVEQGREEAAAEYFEQAEKKILYVKIPFPLNREASVLALRIEKFRNLDNFETLFRQKFVEARNKLQTNPQEAYIELQDLEAINPDFPGIASAIYDAEIKLGIRIPPPDPAKIRESNELYERAFAIVQSNVRSQFPIALEYLNQAIKLTPDSQKVTNLLDRIEAELGGRTTTVLASTAQQQYKLAEEKYLEGSYYEALRIVNSLMKDEKSSQYPPLLELKRRIESKI